MALEVSLSQCASHESFSFSFSAHFNFHFVGNCLFIDMASIELAEKNCM